MFVHCMLPIPPSCYFGNTAPWPFVATGGPPPGPPAKRQRFLKNSREQTIKRLQNLRAKRSDQEDASLSKQSNCPPPLSEAELIAIFETDDLKTIRNRKKKRRRKNRKVFERKQQEEKRSQQQKHVEETEEEAEESVIQQEAPALVVSLVVDQTCTTTQETKEEEEASEPGEDDTTPVSDKSDATAAAAPPPSLNEEEDTTTATPIDLPLEPEKLPETTTTALDKPSDDPENRDLPLKKSTPEPENHASSSSDTLEGLENLPLEPRKENVPQAQPPTSEQIDDSWQKVRVRKKCKKNKSEKRREHYPRHNNYNNHHQNTTRPYQSKRRMHIVERKRPAARRKKCLVKPRFHLPTIQPYHSPEQETKQKTLSHTRITSADESSSSESLSNCSSDTSESSSACPPSKVKRVCSCWKDFYIYSNDDKKWLAVELLGSTLAHTHNCKYYSQAKNFDLAADSISQSPQPSVTQVSLNEDISETFTNVEPTEMVLLESKNSKSEKATVTTPPQHRTFQPRYDLPSQQPNNDWFEHHNPDMDPEVINFNKRYSGLNLDFPARQQYPFIFTTPVYRY